MCGASLGAACIVKVCDCLDYVQNLKALIEIKPPSGTENVEKCPVSHF